MNNKGNKYTPRMGNNKKGPGRKKKPPCKTLKS